MRFLFNIQTDFAYRLNGKKNVIYQTIIDRFFLARGKSAQADIICYCKMTSAMELDGVTSKDVRNISKRMRQSPNFGRNYSVQWWKVWRG